MLAPSPYDYLLGKVRHTSIGNIRTVDSTAHIDAIMMQESVTFVDEYLRSRARELVDFVNSHLIHSPRHDNALGAHAERKDLAFSARLQQRRQIEAVHPMDGGVLAVVGPLQPEEDVAEHEHGGWTAHLGP